MRQVVRRVHLEDCAWDGLNRLARSLGVRVPLGRETRPKRAMLVEEVWRRIGPKLGTWPPIKGLREEEWSPSVFGIREPE